MMGKLDIHLRFSSPLDWVRWFSGHLIPLFPEIICVREINLNNIHKISLMKSCGYINSSADVLQVKVMFSIVSLL